MALNEFSTTQIQATKDIALDPLFDGAAV